MSRSGQGSKGEEKYHVMIALLKSSFQVKLEFHRLCLILTQ